MMNNKIIIDGYSKYRFFGASNLLDNHYVNKNQMRTYSLFLKFDVVIQCAFIFLFPFFIGYVLLSTFICFCFQIYLHVILSISILSILTYDIDIEQGRRYGTPLKLHSL